MKWSIIIAICIAIFGFIPLMGIPGAIVLTIGEVCAGVFHFDLLCMQGDRAWPAAILATWIWPVTIPISYFLSFRVWKKPRATGARWGIFMCLLLAGALVVSAGMELLARQEQSPATSPSSR